MECKLTLVEIVYFAPGPGNTNLGRGRGSEWGAGVVGWEQKMGSTDRYHLLELALTKCTYLPNEG